jgi:D-beta-D-heptose 7-phosphate kinase/D-beta-D-heptose 1-phosphate adenosyltransferase
MGDSPQPSPASKAGRFSATEVAGSSLRQLDLSGFAALRVLVAGDFMLDEYIWGRVERISPEAPVLVVDVQRETQALGGAGNVVNNLVALGAQVEVLGLVGEDHPGDVLRQELARLGVNHAGLFAEARRRTCRKTRVIGDSQQVVRIDRETRLPADAEFSARAVQFFEERLPHLSAVVLSDYAKGTLTAEILPELIRRARDRGLPVVVDPKGQDYRRYRHATVITPNRKEMAEAVGSPLTQREDLVQAGHRLRKALSLDHLLITLGAEGMLLLGRDGQTLPIPTRARQVFDVSGAGDTVVALMALGLAQWGDAAVAANLANVAAGLAVGKVGTAPVFRSELEQELHQSGTRLEEKIVSLPELSLLVPRLQAQGKKVVFTNGCFDLLHVGHIKFLEDSRRLGDVLIVAVDSDASVRQIKGEGRPVMGAHQRLRILAALEGIDYVLSFESPQLPEILGTLRPDILTKGSNYPAEQVAGREIVEPYGGQVILVPFREPISTAELILRIRQGEGDQE